MRKQGTVLVGMQPYFFPYLGYFDLIREADIWVVADEVQFIERGWMHRNRILHPSCSGWSYISASVQSHPHDTLCKDVHFAAGRGWRDKIIRQLDHYRRWAPFFGQTLDLVQAALEPAETSQAKLCVHGLAVFCDYLSIPFEPRFESDLGLRLEPSRFERDWPLRAALALGADEYLNPPGGTHLYRSEDFETRGVRLRFQEPIDFRYKTRSYGFEPSLSIIDVCMWNSPSEIRAYLDGRGLRRAA